MAEQERWQQHQWCSSRWTSCQTRSLHARCALAFGMWRQHVLPRGWLLPPWQMLCCCASISLAEAVPLSHAGTQARIPIAVLASLLHSMQAREMMSTYDLPHRLYRVDAHLWSTTPKPPAQPPAPAAVPPTSAAETQPDLSIGASLAWPLAGVVPALFGSSSHSRANSAHAASSRPASTSHAAAHDSQGAKLLTDCVTGGGIAVLVWPACTALKVIASVRSATPRTGVHTCDTLLLPGHVKVL